MNEPNRESGISVIKISLTVLAGISILFGAFVIFDNPNAVTAGAIFCGAGLVSLTILWRTP